MKKEEISVTESLLLIDREIYGADGRLLAKCWRVDVAEILLNRLNSQPSLLAACEKSLTIFSKIINEYAEYDAVGRRDKLPIEKILENAIASATTNEEPK